MPTISENDLKRKIITGAVTGITVDTSIYINKKYGFEYGLLAELSQIKSSSINFLMVDIIRNELQKHLEQETKKASHDIKKQLKTISGVLGIMPSHRTSITDIIANYENTSCDRIKKFEEATGAIPIAAHDYANLQHVLQLYSAERPPFSNAKKSEFPDAFALSALEKWSIENGGMIIVISCDSDWENYCSLSDSLICVNKIETVLSAINTSTSDIISVIVNKIKCGEFPRLEEEVLWMLNDRVQDLNIVIDAHSHLNFKDDITEVSLVSVYENILGIIETSSVLNYEEGSDIVLISSIACRIDTKTDISFYTIDSIDKDYIPLGHNNYNKEIDTELDLIMFFDVNGDISIRDVDISSKRLVVDLGAVAPWDNENHCQI